jgi:hypothetical protein
MGLDILARGKEFFSLPGNELQTLGLQPAFKILYSVIPSFLVSRMDLYWSPKSSVTLSSTLFLPLF